MKKRLDVFLYEHEYTISREKANALIMSGLVYVNGEKATKSGLSVTEDCVIEIHESKNNYVSRGGLKLEKAIKTFGIKLKGFIAADIGASTGGFTDCMLSFGATKVYSVDVGYGQLAWELRNNEKVVVLERTNARYLTEKEIPEPLDFASMDVSFISITLILPSLVKLLKDNGEIVCLIKPQFEAGRENVGKNGVVRDKNVHIKVINKIIDFANAEKLSVRGFTYSPIKGPKGNIEYLILLKKCNEDTIHIDIEQVVTEAHTELE